MANVHYILKLSRQFCKIADHFDLEEFSSLPTGIETGRLSPERHTMLSQLQISGIGGSRNTYVLNSRKALKVAKNRRGLEGNEIEFENLKNNSVWLPKVYNRADDFSWIVVELVRPLLNFSEIEGLIGIDGELFDYLMGDRDYYSSFQSLIESILFDLKENDNDSKYSRFDPNALKACLDNKFLMELDKLINRFSLSSVEFTDIDNLGKSVSGHLVLLDIGELR